MFLRHQTVFDCLSYILPPKAQANYVCDLFLFSHQPDFFSYLRAFASDRIKFDRNFMAGRDAGVVAIIRSLVGIGSGVDATARAEGFEK
ncbi:hypothetical protein EV130_109268 [Rhizobium azibense]|uniref:EAL domain-containing protein n=1 Tax=Rhizobium azibense TaxID=1136135 RepID=A0A4R3QQT8_9HYPH|nr:hypothetical protein EV130_109268 [Rhizobium azibense]